jgi:CDP-glucose 4,6-dehydratase
MEYRFCPVESLVRSFTQMPETSCCFPSDSFWCNKSVLLTGHTGFKGAWLAIWLHALGARVTGYALEPPTDPSLFQLARVGQLITSSVIADIRDGQLLQEVVNAVKPEVVIHMAAQSLVRTSYSEPVATYATNVMGTVNLLEAVRHSPEVRAVINVTTDKCYENRELGSPFKEDEPMGGDDPYSSSKACSELLTKAWRRSFFNCSDGNRHQVAVATARAGNVIGGGDWAQDRLLPDFFRSVLAGNTIKIRNPQSIRPWQHVLEPLSGYLVLAERLYEQGAEVGESWNFGPAESGAQSVASVAECLCTRWGQGSRYELDRSDQPPEAGFLRLDSSKARSRLGWQPRWNLEKAIDATVDWVLQWQAGADPYLLTQSQIEQYEATSSIETTQEM